VFLAFALVAGSRPTARDSAVSQTSLAGNRIAGGKSALCVATMARGVTFVGPSIDTMMTNALRRLYEAAR
jgi:hypothetical protein